jgi:hypothetical protein
MFCEEYILWSSSLWNCIQHPVASSLSGQNILLSNLYSNILNLCYSFAVKDQISYPYIKTGTIIVLNILIFKFLDRRQWFELNGRKHFQKYNPFLISSIMKFWFVTAVPKYLNFVINLNDLLATFILWFCFAFWWRGIKIYVLSLRLLLFRAVLWQFEVLRYVKFKRPQKFETRNIYLLFWLKGTLKNKQDIDVNERILLALV